jgi:hypothetical protein
VRWTTWEKLWNSDSMIGIVTLNSDTFTNPTLYALIKTLNDSGTAVTIYCGIQEQQIPKELNLTKYHPLPTGLFLPRRPDKIFKYLKEFLQAIYHIKTQRITNLLAIDIFGLVMTGRIHRFLKTINIHYCSFEIFFASEIPKESKIFGIKQKEIKYSKYVASILIQDQERKSLLQKENNISEDFKNWHLIPVASLISPAIAKTYQKTDFGLKESDIVYIFSGSVSIWSGILDVISAIEKGLPENVWIFIHNRSKFDAADSIHAKLLELQKAGKQVILHDEHIEDYNTFNSFLKCFDYGIVIYKPDKGLFTGLNIKEIGLASGKFSSYMLAGLPTLLSECNTYKRLVEQYKIGDLITEEKDLSFHINAHSLQSLSAKDCVDFYKEALDPSDKIMNYIQQFS